jgi:hypothetical protein
MAMDNGRTEPLTVTNTGIFTTVRRNADGLPIAAPDVNGLTC